MPLVLQGSNHEEIEKEQAATIVQIVLLLVLLVGSFLVGIIPLFTKTSMTILKKYAGYLKVFGASIALSTALFYLIPEGRIFCQIWKHNQEHDHDHDHDHDKKNDDHDHEHGGIPHWMEDIEFCCLMVFVSYSIMLLLNKIIFSKLLGNSGHHHHHHHHHTHDHDHDHELKSNKNKDLDEEVFKNMVSTKGKLGSFMYINNERRKSMASNASNNKEGTNSNTNNKRNSLKLKKSSFNRASIILAEKDNNNNENKDINTITNNNKQEDLFVNPDNIEKKLDEKLLTKGEDKCEHHHDHHDHKEDKKEDTTAKYYVILAIVSIHGFFEGFCIGIQYNLLDTLEIGFFVLLHKLVESFTIGIILKESKFNKTGIIRLLILFVVITPFGILLGMVINYSLLVRGLFFGICSGCLIYATCSDSIVEEFSDFEKRWTNFGIYMLGAVIVGTVACINSVNNPVVPIHDH